MKEMANASWEGHTLLKTGLSARRHTQTDRQTDRQTDTHTQVKTVYPPVSLRTLDGHKNTKLLTKQSGYDILTIKTTRYPYTLAVNGGEN